MKKYFRKIILLLIVCLVVPCFSGCNEKNTTESDGMRVAMISTPIDISDQSYNAIVYSTAKEFCEKNNLPFTYYRTQEEATDSYLSVIDAAINDGYNVIVLNNYLAARAIRLATEANPDVKFIAVDVEQDNFGKNYKMPENLTCCVFEEGYAGYMAGYAAVKEGYRHLGFMGGIATTAVLRYAYGFVQGADAAAKELNADVKIEYVYANQFYGDADITAYMNSWYQSKGVDVVFACAGRAWTSVATAATEGNGKVIGVDTDQRGIINEYAGKDIAITAAMKGLDTAVRSALETIYDGRWSEIGGQSFKRGLVDKENLDNNYVRLPTDNWVMKNFTVNDYKKLVRDLYDKKLTFSDNISEPPKTSITVNYSGSIK